MSNPDSQFIKRFTTIIGLMTVVALALIFLSRAIMATTPTAYTPAGDAANAAGAQTPPASAESAATVTAASSTPASAAGTGADAASAGGNGEAIYQQVCSVCHGLGIAGAPKVGDAAAWAPRIAQGKPTLYDHALHGFNGKAGVMAPKAGRSDLSDASIQAAVDYMITKSGG